MMPLCWDALVVTTPGIIHTMALRTTPIYMLWLLYTYRGCDHHLVLTHPVVPYLMYVLYNTYEINLHSAPLLYTGIIIILQPGQEPFWPDWLPPHYILFPTITFVLELEWWISCIFFWALWVICLIGPQCIPCGMAALERPAVGTWTDGPLRLATLEGWAGCISNL